jgi:nucleotide-binding universal stress UspA family protein
MKFRDILAVVSSQAEDSHVLAFAGQLRRQWGARITTLVTKCKPDLVLTSAADDLRAQVERTIAGLRGETEAGPVVSELVGIGEARSSIGMRARHFDAVVVGRPPSPTSDWPHALLEGALFQSGRPVFVAPASWQTGPVGGRIMLCWKPTREAARALTAAHDLLPRADRVMVATAAPRRPLGGEAAQEAESIVAHLRRKKIDVSLLSINLGDRSEAEAILEQAASVRADLVVMGGYGRSAAAQFFFGGVTREMLASANVPLLMAH